MEKKIKYSELTEEMIEQLYEGERLILTSETGEEVAALVSP